MSKVIKTLVSMILILGIISGSVFAQMGVGIKVPAINLFISNLIAENTRIEAGVSIQALLYSVIALDVAGKRYFTPFDVGIALQPYVGLDLTISLAGGAIFFSPAALVGAEYHIVDTGFNIFLEVGLGLTFGSLGIGFAPGGQLGARFDF